MNEAVIQVFGAISISICASAIGACIGGIFGFWLGKNYKMTEREEPDVDSN